MKLSYTLPRYDHEQRFLHAFILTAKGLGHTIVSHPDDADLHLRWGVHHPPAGIPTITVELGWLPRWWYQVSHTGINADHHLAQPKLEPIDREQGWKADCLLQAVRHGTGRPGGWGYLDMDADPLPSLPNHYLLAPLQMESDINMAHVPDGCKTNQGFVDFVTEHARRHAPDLRIVFKQHPHSQAGSQLALEMRRNGDKVYPHRLAHVYSYLKDPRCVAVLGLNSNVINECLLWDKPAVAFGRGIWPDGVFLKSLAHIDQWDTGAEMRRMYVYWLSKVQWELRSAADPRRVEAAIREGMQ